MAKRLSIDDKKNIVSSFTQGVNVDDLSKKFSCTKFTIIRNLKQNIGEDLYRELSEKNNSYKKINKKEVNKNKKFLKDQITKEITKKEIILTSTFDTSTKESEFSHSEAFVEITPLNYEIEHSPRKELSSVPISEIDFPKIVYIIVDKNIELKIKLLKDYPEWDFLPNSDLNRKSIEIYHDIKDAKRFCNKEQKVIKVPNTDVFKIVAPILISRGISRIVSSNQLIAL